MASVILYDLILTLGEMPQLSAELSLDVELSAERGELQTILEPINVTYQNDALGLIGWGDTFDFLGQNFQVTNQTLYDASVVYDFGASTALVSLYAFEISNGNFTFTLYAPADNAGPLPHISTITLLTQDSFVLGIPIAEIAANDDVTLVCFAAGTEIRCEHGTRPIETLKPGNLVWTLDAGLQPLVWLGSRRVRAIGDFAPVVISAGTLGNSADLVISPQHRLLVQGWRAELFFGESEVLVAAKYLLDGDRIYQRPGGWITYHHLMFARHQIVETYNVHSESLFVGHLATTGLLADQRVEILTLFPELDDAPTLMPSAVRRSLRRPEALVLMHC